MALPPLVTALMTPQIYPEPPAQVELVQTQMSFIFLAGDFVYKVKKAVNLGYLDYTTIAQRRYFCERELALNRRLCPDAYLAVVPVTAAGARITLDGPGQVVDYAVKMRRLPLEKTLDHLLGQGKATLPMLTQVASTLARFHEGAETSPAISAYGTPEAIRVNTEENFTQTAPYVGRTISPTEWDNIQAFTNRFLDGQAALLTRRAAGGRIRDCHGDLHAAHICFGASGICIFDCIEFNDRFRYCDVASEIAFLAMDLDNYERPDLADHFVRAYSEASGDADIMRVLNFYKCYRAYVRGKVNGFKYDDPYVPAGEKEAARDAARHYFNLAQSYALAEETGK